MNSSRTCPQCQQPLPDDAPEGLCPACVMQNLAASQPGEPTHILPEGGKPVPLIDIADPGEVAKRLPQFEIIELLGRGGMGVVYKARQIQLDRMVALKILPPEESHSADFIARFTREARSLAKLNHPNIVTVYDFGENDGLYYFIMEFVDGANLRQLLQSKKLTADEALAIVPKVCDALEYAHQEGVVHRDIKPENILMDKKGRVKIADFGLAKLLRREALDVTLTLAGSTLGTLRYMAPEQMDKPETVDHRADIYSLGVVFYEMLTGETPVGRFQLPSQMAKVDARLDEIVIHALEKEPARRYQHASEVKTDVEKVACQAPPTEVPVTPAPPPANETLRKSVESKPVELTPLPRFFRLRCFVALMLGWIAVAAFWNRGLAGFLLSSVIMAAIVKQIGRSYANRNRLWVEKLRARDPWKRFAILFVSLSELVLVFMLFLSGLFLLWESSRLQANQFAPSSEAFEAQYRGKEYQLIRQLDVFKDQVPAVELTKDFMGTSLVNRLPAPFGWLFVIVGLLCLFYFFQQSAGEQAHLVQGPRRGGWRAAFSCTGIFAFSLLGASIAHDDLRSLHLNGRSMRSVSKDLVIPANVNQATNALNRWAAENGCDSASNRWSIQTVPKGDLVGKVEVLDAWKDSRVERWRMTAHGVERPFPHIAVQIIGSEKPVQTKVMINCGFDIGSLVEKDSEKEKQWQAIMKSLSDAVSRAPEFNPSFLVTPKVQLAETGPEWPGLCVVLVVMLLWVFVTVRYLTPMAASKEANEAAREKTDRPDNPSLPPVLMAGAVSPPHLIGRLSLWLAIGGLLIPVVSLMIGYVFVGNPNRWDVLLPLCLVLHVVLEVAALGCGLAAWRSRSGKAGLIIALLSLVLDALLISAFTLFTVGAVRTPGPSQSRVEPTRISSELDVKEPKRKTSDQPDAKTPGAAPEGPHAAPSGN